MVRWHFGKNRLKKFGVKFITSERFGESYVTFQDPDGLELELVERQGESNQSLEFRWDSCRKSAIKGFAGAILISAQAK